nr:hypothetical protein [Tanacetum cinerariifolium]
MGIFILHATALLALPILSLILRLLAKSKKERCYLAPGCEPETNSGVRAFLDAMVWRHPKAAFDDLRPAAGSFNMANVQRLSVHVIKLRDMPEGVLVLSGLSRIWKSHVCDLVLRGADGNVMGIHDFLCLLEWTGAEAVIPDPTPEDIAIGTPSFNIVAKAKTSCWELNRLDLVLPKLSVIENGISWVSLPQTAQENGVSVTMTSIHVTAEEKTNKKNDVKARSLLLMAPPNEHQLTFKVKKSVGASTGAQNMAFMTAPSISSTNDVNTANPAYEASTISSNVNTASPQVSTANFSDNDVEYRAQRNQDGRFKNQNNTRKHGNNEDTSSKEMLAIDGVGFDWSDMAEEKVQTNMALMAFLDSENGVLFSKEVAVIKREVACKDYELNVLKNDSKQNSDDSFVKEQVSEDTSSFVESPLNVDKETAFSVDKKIEFVKPKNYANQLESQLVATGTISDEFAGTQRNLNADVKDDPHNEDDDKDKFEDDSSPKEVNAARKHVNTASLEVNTGHFELNVVDPLLNIASSSDPHSPTDMFKLGASDTLEATNVVFYSDRDAPKVNLGNIPNSYGVPTTSHTRIYKDHPIKNVTGEMQSSVQTRRMTKPTYEKGFLSDVYEEKTYVEAMQEELLQFKLQQVWILVDLPYGKKAIGKNRQEEGLDYEEVFALVARIEANRLFLAYASFMGFLVYQMDVKSAFLYRTIKEEIYVTQPPGFKDPDYPNKVLQGGQGTLWAASSSKSMDKYVKEILKKFNYSDVKSASTPVDLEKHLVKDGDVNDVDVHLYRSMIGSLMYLTASRPDIMFVVYSCSRFQVTLKTSHLLAVKRIFRYLKGKPTLGLWYPRDSSFELVAYTDSDYAGAIQDRKSITRDKYSGFKINCWIRVIYVSLNRQFWETASSSTSENGEIKKTATINGRVKSVTEASIRRHLKLENSKSISNLPNTEIFEQLALMGVSKGYSEVDVPLFPAMLVQGPVLQSDPTISPPLISLPLMVPTPPHDSPLPRGNTPGSKDGRMTLNEMTALCTSLSKKVESLESDLKQTKLTYNDVYTKLIIKVKKLEHKVKSSKARKRVRLNFSKAEDDLEDPSKQERKIAQIDKDEGITLVKGVAFRDVKKTPRLIRSTTTLQPLPSIDPKDKGKGVLVKEELVKVKRRDQGLAQIESDAELAQRLYEEEIDANHELAARLTYEEQKQFIIQERAKLLAEFFKRRKKQFAAERINTSQKRKASTSSVTSSHVVKRTRSALPQTSGSTTHPSLFMGDDEESDDDDAFVEIQLVTPLHFAVVITSLGNLGRRSVAPTTEGSNTQDLLLHLRMCSVMPFIRISFLSLLVHTMPHISKEVESLSDDQLTAKISVLHYSRLKGYKEKVANITGLELQVAASKKHVSRLNDKLTSSDASFAKYKTKGNRRKKKIKSLGKGLDNLHAEVARLSAALNQATILEAERDEEILQLKATPSVQGEPLSLVSSDGFERGLSMHQTKDEFVAVLMKMIFEYAAEPLSVILQLEPEKLVHLANIPILRSTRVSPTIAKELTVTYVSESLELFTNVNLTVSTVSFEHNKEMGISIALDDVTELVEVGLGHVPSGPDDVMVALSAHEKGNGLDSFFTASEEAVVNPPRV